MREFHALLREWETYYLLVGTAAATLAGLMFIALNFGSRLAPRPTLAILRSHSDPALLALVYSLVLSALLLMPSLTPRWFAVALIASGVLSLGYIGVVLRQLIGRRLVRTWDASDWLWYAVAPVLGGVLMLISGGLGLAGRTASALNLVGVLVLVLVVMGIRNAWDLVTFSVARTAAQEHPTEPVDL